MVGRGFVSRSLLFAMFLCSPAFAIPQYMIAWAEKYPASTLPSRMAVMGESMCNVCHHPPALDDPGNCYRRDFADLLHSGLNLTQALDQLDTMDSDGDGVTNGEEATTPHADFPGEVGYNMGLIGDDGTDPCAIDPDEVVTGALETPPEPVPTLSEWGMIWMTLLLLTAGTTVIRRRTPPHDGQRAGC